MFRGTDDGVGFWLPVLSRVVSKVAGVTDWNIVQNNGEFPRLSFPYRIARCLHEAVPSAAGITSYPATMDLTLSRRKSSTGRAACSLPHHPQAGVETGDQEQELDHVWTRAER